MIEINIPDLAKNTS